MDFEQRLQKAIQRGQKRKESAGREAAAKEFSEDELRRLHTSARLELSETIETGLKRLADHFPGFQYQSVMDDGLGAKISRDDFTVRDGSRQNLFSQFQMRIRPLSDAKIVELVAKGTIRNKEVIARSHYQMLKELDLDAYHQLIETWLVEYAERYAAES